MDKKTARLAWEQSSARQVAEMATHHYIRTKFWQQRLFA
jgi:hypothetical protein